MVYLGANIKKHYGRIDISVFDKAADWPFPVIRYPHHDSNVPYHQPAGVFIGQLGRYRIVCNTIKNFKHATTQMVLRLLGRGHKTAPIMKGWNKHLNKFAHDRITNYSRLRHWFRRMLKWASYHYKQTVPTVIWKPKQSKPTPNPIPKSKPVWKPKHSPQDYKRQNHKWVPKQLDPSAMAEQQQKNKQFCKEFLSQLNTTILPADVKCSKENSNTQQEQDNGEKSGMNLNQNDQYTPFERLLLKYKDAFHLEEGLIQNIHRLVEALDKRDKYPGVSSKSRVTCPKCDQHYWNEHKLHSKGHITSCERAQSVNAKLLLLNAGRLDSSLKTTEQNQQQTVLEVEPQVVTENAERHLDDSSHKVHDEQAYQALSAHQNPTVNIDEGEKWEKEI